MLPYFTAEFARRNEVLVKSMVKQIAKNVHDGAFAERSDEQKRATAGFDVSRQLGSLRMPTLVIHGAEDRIIPMEAGEELARGIPGARLEVLDDAGHLLLAERPKELYGLVTEFFGASD
jgi:pimeloyl-ACP methyl ester carboxylesterase